MAYFVLLTAQLVTDTDYRAPTTCSLFENNAYSVECTELQKC